MADENTTTEAAAENILSFNLNDKIGDTAASISIDRAKVPPAARLELLDNAIRTIVNGRAHSALMRHNKAEAEYKAACEKDPTFSGAAPVAPDLAAIAAQAVADLYEGKLRQRGKGGSKERTAKDPVDAVVTQAVIRELFEKRKKENAKTKYQEVVKEVGESGIKYLEARATTLAAGDDKRHAELTKQIENKYLKPARMMVSQNAKGEAQDNELL